jgi:hypothetical protein
LLSVQGVHHSPICTRDVDRPLRLWHGEGGPKPPRSGIGAAAPTPSCHGSFLLALRGNVDETLSAAGTLGFDDGVQHVTVATRGGNPVTVAVITAPAGGLVGLIGPVQ